MRALIETCHPAFELIEDRYADYSTMDALSLIADNCWCGGVVLGPAVIDWQTLALDQLTGTLEINGKKVVSHFIGIIPYSCCVPLSQLSTI